MDRIWDTNDVRDTRADKLAKHNLVETARFFADVYVLTPGQAQAPHEHAGEDKCYFVLEGQGTVTSGAETFEATPGQLVWCPAGDVHGVENTGTGILRLLVYMAPHPRASQMG